MAVEDFNHYNADFHLHDLYGGRRNHPENVESPSVEEEKLFMAQICDSLTKREPGARSANVAQHFRQHTAIFAAEVPNRNNCFCSSVARIHPRSRHCETSREVPAVVRSVLPRPRSHTSPSRFGFACGTESVGPERVCIRLNHGAGTEVTGRGHD